MSTTTEPLYIWEFEFKDSDLDGFECLGTVAEANELHAALDEQSKAHEYTMKCPEIPRISDMLIEIEISNTMANDH
jgi:hypothetical protein